ncbi:MAG: maleylpyruvate isomerase family mycothiol-dependent enzyme [Actinomycetota bacterium]
MDAIMADLQAEQRGLESLLRTLAPERWSLPTPAAGWDVRDQVSHLADTEEIAHDTATGGPRQLNEEALTHPSAEAFTESGCIKGRAMQPAEVLEWWVAGAARTREAIRGMDPKQRVPWGLGMSARAFATARLMETWAHGLDIRAAAGEQPNITPRLRNVAWLVTNAVPYAFRIAGADLPPGTLRVEVTGPDGDLWTFGPDDATDRISGDAGEYCRVGVQRMKRADATTLKAEGLLAEAALSNLRAFL